MRRSPMPRRTKPIRPRSARRDAPTIDGFPVTMGDLRRFVIARDGGCVLRHVTGHVCRDRYGWPAPYAVTLEHVTQVHGPTDGRHDDDAHTVALCEALNGGSMRLATADDRALMRSRLRDMHPECGRAVP